MHDNYAKTDAIKIQRGVSSKERYIEIQIADHRAMILFALSNSRIACEGRELPHEFYPFARSLSATYGV